MNDSSEHTQYRSYYQSTLGPLAIVATAQGLLSLEFTETTPRTTTDTYPILKQVVEQLDEYFALKRKTFTLPLALVGTPFQKKVWHELRRIPFGETVSYKQVAQAIGNPQAVRAVGTANGKNPIPIIIPCHRVIRHNGNLGGYGGGLSRKEWLLHHERRST